MNRSGSRVNRSNRGDEILRDGELFSGYINDKLTQMAFVLSHLIVSKSDLEFLANLLSIRVVRFGRREKRKCKESNFFDSRHILTITLAACCTFGDSKSASKNLQLTSLPINRPGKKYRDIENFRSREVQLIRCNWENARLNIIGAATKQMWENSGNSK